MTAIDKTISFNTRLEYHKTVYVRPYATNLNLCVVN